MTNMISNSYIYYHLHLCSLQFSYVYFLITNFSTFIIMMNVTFLKNYQNFFSMARFLLQVKKIYLFQKCYHYQIILIQDLVSSSTFILANQKYDLNLFL